MASEYQNIFHDFDMIVIPGNNSLFWASNIDTLAILYMLWLVYCWPCLGIVRLWNELLFKWNVITWYLILTFKIVKRRFLIEYFYLIILADGFVLNRDGRMYKKTLFILISCDFSFSWVVWDCFRWILFD